MTVAQWSSKQLKQTRAFGESAKRAAEDLWDRQRRDVRNLEGNARKRWSKAQPALERRRHELWALLAGLVADATATDPPRRIANVARDSVRPKSLWRRLWGGLQKKGPTSEPVVQITPGLLRGVRRTLVITAGSAILLGGTAVKIWQMAREAEKRYPAHGRFVSVRRVRLHYFEKGTGRPVVLLHGNATCADEMVLSGIFDLIARDHRVVAFDRPGFGYSARFGRGNWTPERQARLLREAFRQLNLERPVIVAHSFATLVALAMAEEFPDEVGGLILISGQYFPTPRAELAFLSPTSIPIVGDVLRYTISPLLWRLAAPKMMEQMFAPQPVAKRFKESFPLELVLRPEQIHATSADAVLMLPAIGRLRRNYGQIDAPTILMAGADDRIADPKRHSLRLSRLLVNGELRMFPGLGHMLHFAAPKSVADAVDAIVGEQRLFVRDLGTIGARPRL